MQPVTSTYISIKLGVTGSGHRSTHILSLPPLRVRFACTTFEICGAFSELREEPSSACGQRTFDSVFNFGISEEAPSGAATGGLHELATGRVRKSA